MSNRKDWPPVIGEHFTQAWINLAELPGGMMQSYSPERGHYRYGPIPALTRCSITTNPDDAQRWRESGEPVLAIYTAGVAPTSDGCTAHVECLGKRCIYTTPSKPAGVAGTPAKLWLWKNFVDGKPEYWAFDNPFPVNLDDGDPQTLGEPCGYAIFKPSRIGRTDVSEAEVMRRIAGVPVSVPHGWKLVPLEPTEEMLSAVRKKPHPTRPDGWDAENAKTYQRMLSHAPNPHGVAVPAPTITDHDVAQACYAANLLVTSESMKDMRLALEGFVKARSAGVAACDQACRGNDSESHCVRTNGPYCGVTNPNLAAGMGGTDGC